MADLTDLLTITGLGVLDGDYTFDIVDLVNFGQPGCLNYRELHKIKMMTGLRRGEIIDALHAGDTNLDFAIACVVLARHGRNVDEDALWDAPAGAGITFDFYSRDEVVEEDPFAQNVSDAEQSSSSNGSGGDTTQPSESPEKDPSRTGLPGSERSVVSGPPTSVL